ncbi:type III PLP-dependent enzyme [Halomonas binhaiensis]|uniref:Type III PLP-dependent enzyme n=1 Tax=Halomonas binhaiensis TaxID=2562282 RepID=A0A5C1NHF5_9GAMM|nr:type III PLP-dependent enzyme [Halomonas binhaiensis]QEM82726.1 type III PLP-dependent enzyme [Halomonas binhaiensis]
MRKETLFEHIPEHIVAAIKQRSSQERDPLAAFFYDLTALAEHARGLKAALPRGVELFYAIKANSEAPILETLAPIVDGFELSSGGEIARALGCSQSKPWVLSGPGKLDSDMEQAIAGGIEAFHVESLNEIARLQRIAERAGGGNGGKMQKVLLRINPSLPDTFGSRLKMAGAPTPFGIDESDLGEAVRAVEAASHLELVGFHIHAMSHQKDVTRHRELIAFYLSRWPQWCALASRPETLTQLNVGGGIGVNYQINAAGQINDASQIHDDSEQFDWPLLCQGIEEALAQIDNPPRLRFEIGRFISAFCGYYVIEVLDQKTSHGEHFLVCRGGTHQFRLPAAQSHDHPVIHLPLSGATPAAQVQAQAHDWTVVGQLCTPKDVLSRGQRMRGVEVGDLLVLPLAGAYGYNISHADFLCHPRPAQIFVQEPETDNAPAEAKSSLASCV